MDIDESSHLSADAQRLLAIERLIRVCAQGADVTIARTALREYLWSRVEGGGEGSIADATQELAKSGRHLPAVAAVLVRSLAVHGLFPIGGSGAKIDRALVTLVDRGLPSFSNFVGVSAKAQTFENVPKLRDAHQRVCEILAPLRTDFQTLEGLISARQPIMSALSHSSVRAYGETFCLSPIRGIIEDIIHTAQEVSHSRTTFLMDVERCSKSIQDGLGTENENGSFLFYDFLLPFLERCQQALRRFIDSARSRFSSRIIGIVREGEALPKRYPLHETAREIQIRVPLRNVGPGLAIDVRAEISITAEGVALQTPKVVLGDVSHGDFSLPFDAMVIEPTADFEAVVMVDWGEAGSDARESAMYTFKVAAQAADIDWSSLEYWHPYSTDAAEGDRFIGRGEIVRDLASRLLRDPMEPFYITGQKRIGKTSLALASTAFAESHTRQREIHSTYILWGQIAYADAKVSLAEFGRAIESLVVRQLPVGVVPPKCVFDGSLAPLMRLAEVARRNVPDKHFVVIIDEFDEIHQDLFLQGSLAETFFANLRALATAKNICLILVGGENMPFLMERQGEKLNKFTRKNLNYFSRASEWDDFQNLIRRPSCEVVQWHDSAISAIFNETNGNPYFTNLLCSRVLREAVRLRDTDVAAEEVRDALEVEISSLDANSFAHLWHDGIFKPLAEREPDILRRRRVLVALARCARKQLPLTTSNLSENKGLSNLNDSEIGPTLNEFQRRGVLSEDDGVYRFTLPIFERWLSQYGLSIIQPDAVSEELASIAQAQEDSAFIQSEEVAALARKWPTYQGRHIGSDEIRAWYQQVEGFRDQRLLFRLLQSVRFITEDEIREKCRTLYIQLRKQLNEFVRRSLMDRRSDILITYLDGHGKSGEYISSLFAEENKIAVANICSSEKVAARLESASEAGKPISAVIVVDDVAATGRTLADSVLAFALSNGEAFLKFEAKLFICALYSTRDASDFIGRKLSSLELSYGDFRIGEVLGSAINAFSLDSTVWATPDDRERAKALVTNLGARIYKSQPLGHGGLGLLLVFPTTVPNNSLPILHSSSKGGVKRWTPLFLRPTN